MWLIIGIVLFFLWCIISPFLPKEGGASAPPVINNVIHIINSPVINGAPSQAEPKQNTSEEGLFGNIQSRIKF